MVKGQAITVPAAFVGASQHLTSATSYTLLCYTSLFDPMGGGAMITFSATAECVDGDSRGVLVLTIRYADGSSATMETKFGVRVNNGTAYWHSPVVVTVAVPPGAKAFTVSASAKCLTETNNDVWIYNPVISAVAFRR